MHLQTISDIQSSPTDSVLSQTPFAQTQTRKKQTYVIVSFFAVTLIASIIVVIAKVVILNRHRMSPTTETSTKETTTMPMWRTETHTTLTTTMQIVEVNDKTTWEQYGNIVAGGYESGTWLDQLNMPASLDIDGDLTVYVADKYNHRVVKWRLDATFGEVVAGGKGQGNRIDQLRYPQDVVIDRNNASLLICDQGNKRVIRSFHQNVNTQASIILRIDCFYLAMDKNGDLYVSFANTIHRWREGEPQARVVAGGNGEGDALNQLGDSDGIFVDDDCSVYIADSSNHRVMKWFKDAEQGIVVAGGQGQGNNLTQLDSPTDVLVDHFGNVYVVDTYNNRIMRFPKESRQGTVIIGLIGGSGGNDLGRPGMISFDRQGNLYVVINYKHSVQKFDVHR